jgi:hypothetical protein
MAGTRPPGETEPGNRAQTPRICQTSVKNPGNPLFTNAIYRVAAKHSGHTSKQNLNSRGQICVQNATLPMQDAPQAARSPFYR